MTAEITVDMLVERLTRWEHLSQLKNYVITALVLVCLLLGSGWWYSARDHSEVKRNGGVADCRSVAFAEVLDQFAIVAGDFPKVRKDRASEKLQELYADDKTLEKKYQDCIEDGGG